MLYGALTTQSLNTASHPGIKVFISLSDPEHMVKWEEIRKSLGAGSPLVTLHHKYTLLFACCPMPLRNPTPSFHFLFQAAKAPQALCAKRSWVVVVCVSPSLARNESAGQPWALRNLSFRHVTVSKKPRGLYHEVRSAAVYPSSEITD